MNKILLISSGLEAIKDFVGRPPETLRMVFIPTAGNPDKDVWWIDKDRDVLTHMGFRYTELDIANTPIEQLTDSLDDVDLVYVAGGYTYYLLEQIRNTGFDAVLTKFMEHGGSGFNTRIFGGEYNSLYFKLINRSIEPVTRKETESISLVEKETWWREIVSIEPTTKFGELPDFIKRRNHYSDLELMAKHVSGL
jgi:hypothetical protein